MAEQAKQETAPAPAGALVAHGVNSQLFAGIRSDEVKAQVEHYLEGSNLTFDRLLLDLGAVLTANPKTAAKARPAGLYNCVITAARYQTSFGDGGMWVIPGADDDPNDVRPQESEKFIVERAKEDAGADRIEALLVYKADEPVAVQRFEDGGIKSFTLNNENFTAPRNLEDLIGGFGVVHFRDDRTPRIEWFTRVDLDNRKNHSAAAAAGKAPAWKSDWAAMYQRSMRAAMGRLVNPVRSRAPGMVGGLISAGSGDQAIEAEYSEILESEDQLTNALVGHEPEATSDVPKDEPPQVAEGPVESAVGKLEMAWSVGHEQFEQTYKDIQRDDFPGLAQQDRVKIIAGYNDLVRGK